jgi:LmbE family N-acetylglucosaminyl deacetylase
MSTLPVFSVANLRYLIRHTLNRCLRCALRLRSRPYPIKHDTVTLVFAPHPDDEALGCGGLLTLKRIEGATVGVTYITDGCASHPGHPRLTPAAVAAQRQAEAKTAMGLLGVERAALQFLGVPDGTLMHLDVPATDGLVSRIAEVIRLIGPGEIFLPCRRDGSSEHDSAFIFVARAIGQTGLQPRVMEFPVWSWWNPLLLIRPLLTCRRVWRLDFRNHENVKRQALAAYASQVRPAPPWEKAVLSREFVSFFLSSEEFFFER